MHANLILGGIVASLLIAARAAPVLVVNTTLAQGNELEARGFSYQNNDITFTTQTGISKIFAAQFIVADFSISPGQDPNSRNQVGQSHMLSGTNGHFEFQVGRHKTAQVASWWDQHVSADSNNYGYNPDALNFAFFGKLVLGFDNGRTVIFDGISLAQGSNSLGNNWWVGGGLCSHLNVSVFPPFDAFDNLECLGRDLDGNGVDFTFAVGKTAGLLNQVRITDVSW